MPLPRTSWNWKNRRQGVRDGSIRWDLDSVEGAISDLMSRRTTVLCCSKQHLVEALGPLVGQNRLLLRRLWQKRQPNTKTAKRSCGLLPKAWMWERWLWDVADVGARALLQDIPRVKWGRCFLKERSQSGNPCLRQGKP